MNHISIPAKDGFQLAATIYEPAADGNGALIVVSSATAVPRKYYRSFARFLSKAGYIVVTYDYRGTGGSRPERLKGFPARMRDWGELDMAGVIDWVHDTYQPKKLFHIGHSVGGQVTGLLDNYDKIDAMVTMSSQSGYWRLQGGNEKLKVWFFVTFLFPVLSTLFGYFPWSRVAAGEDLPKGVALEWAKWCRSPNYLFDDKSLTSLRRFPGFSAPILAFSFDDDDWGTERSVNALMRHYTGAQVERRHIIPAEYGLKSIGHFGFFLTRSKSLWSETFTWLNEQLEETAMYPEII